MMSNNDENSKELYLSKDSRTGTPEGSTVMLDLNKLNRTKFNVFLQKVVDPASSNKDFLRSIKQGNTERLREDLRQHGLSLNRISTVLEFCNGSKEELAEKLGGNLENSGLDELTILFLATNGYGESVKENNTKSTPSKKPKTNPVDGDLDGDGDFDKDDLTIAARVMAKGRKLKRDKKKREMVTKK